MKKLFKDIKLFNKVYNLHTTNVYACFLDASKAFDKVNHWHLFKKLLYKGVPKLIVRLLMYWYISQQFAVKWCNVVSPFFTVSNGVRQGGVLSPVLYNLFIDDLSVQLMKSNVGCIMNDVRMNHLMYADDSVILAPSPSGLQKLLLICEKFASDNELTFNAKKTKCMYFCTKSLYDIYVPSLTLNGNILACVEQHNYLGVILCSNQADDCDIYRQMKTLYARGNILVCKLRSC